jgi:hypothetical protein
MMHTWNQSTLNAPRDGVADNYLSNDAMVALLCDARVNGPLTAGLLVLGEWPEDFEPYQGRIVIIRSGAKKSRKRQRTEKKIMWKSPRGWKVLKNVHCDDVMVQYRARSDEQYRYRMFCFRSGENTRDESLALLHVCYTPGHVAKGTPPRATSSLAMRFPGETSLADDAALFYDNSVFGGMPASICGAPQRYGGFGDSFPPASPASSADYEVVDEDDLEPPRKRQKRDACEVSADVDLFSALSPPEFGLPSDLFAAYPAFQAERDVFLPQLDVDYVESADPTFDLASFFAPNLDSFEASQMDF